MTSNWSDEETNEPLLTDHQNYYRGGSRLKNRNALPTSRSLTDLSDHPLDVGARDAAISQFAVCHSQQFTLHHAGDLVLPSYVRVGHLSLLALSHSALDLVLQSHCDGHCDLCLSAGVHENEIALGRLELGACCVDDVR
jgi:hypothetical protein